MSEATRGEISEASESLDRWIIDLKISSKQKAEGMKRSNRLLKAFNKCLTELQG